MAALILLNGPPGIGKSTLSALYADRHPGALDLDGDRLHELIGGWRTLDGRTHDLVRPLVLAMASAHLGGGHDVVLPQYLGSVAEIEAFAAVAVERGAAFREIVLLADKAEALDRFDRRDDGGAWGDHNREVVAHHGGDDFLAWLYDQLLEVIRLRPSAIVLLAEREAIEATYSALEDAVS